MSADSLAAREALAAALKKELETTALAKVTVAKLAQSAGVTRQAFYYHFNDVYDCATWVFTTEVAQHILSHASYGEWMSGFEELLVYMQKHRSQVAAILKSLTMQKTERFFFGTLKQMMSAIVDELAPSVPHSHRMSEADREFIIEHYTLAVLGHLLHWLAGGMMEDPSLLVRRLGFVMQGHVTESIERFSNQRY